MERIKIMQITHDLAIGGLQQVVVNICSRIDKSKFDVSVLCLRGKGAFAPVIEGQGIQVHSLPQQPCRKPDYFAFLKVAEILRQERVDIIHTHNTQPFVDGTLGALFAGVKARVHTDHARSFPDKKRYMFAEWAMSHLVDRIAAVSEHTKKNLVTHEKIQPDKIAVVYNGIDIHKYAHVINKEIKRRELGIGERKGPVLGLGVRITKQKGIIYLIQAMELLRKDFPDIVLLIAGDGELLPELKKTAAEMGLADTIVFLGPRLDIPDILKLLDVYVLPSLWEGLPLVILEAMASSLPIVATDVGGNGEAVKNRVNGYTVPPRDPYALYKAIKEILHHEKLRNDFAAKSVEIVSTQFTVEHMVREYQKIYTDLAV